MKTDIQFIIEQMTLEEKAALCIGASTWTTTPVEHLNIPEMIVSDGPHGVFLMTGTCLVPSDFTLLPDDQVMVQVGKTNIENKVQLQE